MSKPNANPSTGAAAQPSMLTPRVSHNIGSIRTGERDHFATKHLLTGLKGRTISSGSVTLGAQAVQFVLTLGSTMILARLLTPQDFGFVAMAATVIGFLRILNDAGLSTATVQREGITHAQVSNLFWTNAIVGGVISLLVMISAPAVAWFFREPRLVPVTMILCTTFLVTGFTVQHLALLKRQMRFKIIAIIQIISMLAGFLLGIGMAWFGYGYWSLVGMYVSTPLVAFVLTWWASPWRPQLPTKGCGTRSLLNFGANMTASSFVWSVARGSDSLLIGRVYGPTSLGLYSRAAALLNRPVEQFVGPLEAVFVPTLSRLQAEPERYRRIFLQTYEVIAVSSFLFSGLLLALSHPLTLVVLGWKWESAAPIFAGFSLVALYTPITCTAGWLLTSQGRGRDFLHVSSISSFVTVVAFLAGLPFGPAAIAVAYSAACLLVQLPVAYYIAGRHGPVTTTDLWSRFFKHLPLWAVVCAITFIVHHLVLSSTPLVQLFVSGSAGFLVGAVFISVYPPARRTALELFAVLKDWRAPQ